MLNGLNIGLILFLVGIYGIITNKNLIKIIMCLNIASNGVILFFISLGYIANGLPPIFTESGSRSTSSSTNATGTGLAAAVVDPVPQALMLTMIVINLCTTALALTLTVLIYNKFGTVDLEEVS